MFSSECGECISTTAYGSASFLFQLLLQPEALPSSAVLQSLAVCSALGASVSYMQEALQTAALCCSKGHYRERIWPDTRCPHNAKHTSSLPSFSERTLECARRQRQCAKVPCLQVNRFLKLIADVSKRGQLS